MLARTGMHIPARTITTIFLHNYSMALKSAKYGNFCGKVFVVVYYRTRQKEGRPSFKDFYYNV